MFDITTIVEIIFAVMGVIITSFVIPYIKKKTTMQQQQMIDGWVKIAVTAAEQTYVGTGRGCEKKEFVKRWLEKHDVTFDDDKIDTLIESAVYELDNGIFIIEGSDNIEDRS